MQPIQIGEDTPRGHSAGSLWPGHRYWFPDMAVETFREQERASGYELISHVPVNMILRPWHGEDKGAVLVYNTGKIGDQLWTSALIHEMKQRHPRLEIDVMATGDSDYLWSRNPDIRSVRLAPLPIDGYEPYDFHLVFDEVTASQMKADQADCYTELFQRAGLSLPERVKPYVRPTHIDEISAYQMVMQPDEQGLVYRTRGHFIIGLHSTSAVRNLPEPVLMDFIAMIASLAPDKKIYCLSNDAVGARMASRVELVPNVIAAHNQFNLMQIAALCRYAQCVIAPDSMLIHVAASQDTPTVALMSTVGPQYRTWHYPFCVPIYNANACRYGDCFHKRPTFHYQLGEISESAKCYTPARESCDIMAAVTVEQIFEALNMAIKRKNDAGGYDLRDLPME